MNDKLRVGFKITVFNSEKTMNYFVYFIVAVLASCCGFLVHLINAEWVNLWVSGQMQNAVLTPSWDVKYVALLTSIEYGLAAVFMYSLMRKQLITRGKLFAVSVFSILLAAIHGAFLRQGLMDWVIGNPFHVVVVQGVMRWLVWVLTAAVVVIGVEFVFNLKREA